jgi:hypothetical protein
MGGRDQIAVRSQLRQIVCKRHYLENTQHKKRAVGKCKALSSNPNTTKKKKKKKKTTTSNGTRKVFPLLPPEATTKNVIQTSSEHKLCTSNHLHIHTVGSCLCEQKWVTE